MAVLGSPGKPVLEGVVAASLATAQEAQEAVGLPARTGLDGCLDDPE